MGANIRHISDATFEEEVLKAKGPVLVDFWAAWCAPCQMIAPCLDHIAESFEDKMKVVKLNVDENIMTPARYGIRGIPTLLLFREGELKETIVGALPQDKIIELLSKHL